MDWMPRTRILADSLEGEATKTSKAGSVGFEGSTSAKSPEINPARDLTELTRASYVLSRAGVRIMQVEGVTTIGVWSDLDGPRIRAALHSLESNLLPVRYLDGAGILIRYKLRWVEGEPVPMNVLYEMERQPEEPWKVRDRMLKEMGWRSKGSLWAAFKAAAPVEQRFQKQCVNGPEGIPAATVRHGEWKESLFIESGVPVNR
jgi:hypothetical protein